MIPACRWGVYGFRPSSYRPRRVFAEGDQHRMVAIPDPRQSHIPRAFPQCFAAAGGERTHSLALRACTRWRVPCKHAARQVDRAFWAPRVGFLTNPLACASSLYARASPCKHAARASGSSVLGASCRVLNEPTRLRFELVRAWARSPYKHAALASGSSVLGASCRVLNEPTRLLRACTRLRVLPTSTQREQVDRAFWAPRFGSLTDPLAALRACTRLARSPYKHAARASGSSVLGASFWVLNEPTRLRFELVRAGAFSLQARSAASGSSVLGASFWVLNGPTRLRFELVRARVPLQARSASKWIRCFGPCRRTAAKPPWSAGTCYRFLVYSRPQTPQFARLGLPSPKHL